MITDLKKLWKQAFGDSDAFIDTFFSVAYCPERSQYLTQDGQLAAMLYWFDCDCRGQRIAYIYAVATDGAYQNRGLCRQLMAKTHTQLKAQGYAGAILVPGSADLFSLYEKLGYRTCSHVTNISCTAGAPIPLHPVTAAEYAALRRKLLPDGGIIQEGAALALLEKTVQFYAGDGFVLTASVEDDMAHVQELLGDADPAGITAALGCKQGRFRTPGQSTPFAMYYSFTDDSAPAYFGLALD